jgi:hypothetical protein
MMSDQSLFCSIIYETTGHGHLITLHLTIKIYSSSAFKTTMINNHISTLALTISYRLFKNSTEGFLKPSNLKCSWMPSHISLELFIIRTIIK